MATTTNYGWVKPVVGGDTDAWGGELNTDLDGIDSTVFAVSGVANAAQTTANAALPLAGGTLTGPITGTSATFSGAVTAGNLSAPQAIGDNRIINGDMRIDQRNNGSSGTAFNVYTIDRWFWASNLNKGTWGRVVGGPPGFAYSLLFTSSAVYSPAATDSFYFQQSIEADMVSDFMWGTASAQPVTLSFWASSNKSGTYSGSVENYAGTRSYPFTFAITSAWTKVVITIPGDSTGSWVMSGNAGSVCINFDLGSGSTYRGPANAWASTPLVGVTGAASVFTTSNTTFYFSGVKLEVGSVATPFNRQSLAKSLADCQRYYWVSSGPMQFCSYGGSAGGYATTAITFPQMRATPTATAVSPSYGNASAVALGGQITANSINASITQSAAGFAYALFTLTLSAEL